jgi:tetratricopeptide (TPR) repeat protein
MSGLQDADTVILESPPPHTVAVTLRTIELARTFPTTLPAGVITPQSTPHDCDDCAKPMTLSLITTWGPAADPRTWYEHPVALHGWRCEACGSLGYPAAMSEAAIKGFQAEATMAVKQRDFDKAEFYYLQLVNAEPLNVIYRFNLGSVYHDKRYELQSIDGGQEALNRYRLRAREQWLVALSCADTPPAIIHFFLGRNYCATGASKEAVKHLTAFLTAPADASEEQLAAAQQLLEHHTRLV